MAGFLIIPEEKLCDAPKPSTCHSGFLDVGRMSKLSRKKNPGDCAVCFLLTDRASQSCRFISVWPCTIFLGYILTPWLSDPGVSLLKVF